MNNVIIKKSSIHNNGLFATQLIQRNKKICDYLGEEMTIRQFTEKYGQYKNNSLYTYRMKRINKILVAKEEPYMTNNLVNYINENNDPNAILKKRALYSLKTIQPNEEITLSYPKEYNRNYILT